MTQKPKLISKADIFNKLTPKHNDILEKKCFDFLWNAMKDPWLDFNQKGLFIHAIFELSENVRNDTHPITPLLVSQFGLTIYNQQKEQSKTTREKLTKGLSEIDTQILILEREKSVKLLDSELKLMNCEIEPVECEEQKKQIEKDYTQEVKSLKSKPRVSTHPKIQWKTSYTKILALFEILHESNLIDTKSFENRVSLIRKNFIDEDGSDFKNLKVIKNKDQTKINTDKAELRKLLAKKK